MTNGFPTIEMFYFDCARIWIDSNQTLVCFYFYFDFIIYFCIRLICMISSWSNYSFEVKVWHFLVWFCWNDSFFFWTFGYDTYNLEVVSNAIKSEIQVKYFKCVFINIIPSNKNGVKNRLISYVKQHTTYAYFHTHISNVNQLGLKDQLEKTNSKSRNDLQWFVIIWNDLQLLEMICK